MDDLRADLRTYFDTAVKAVDLPDIVEEMDYVVAVVPEVPKRGRRGLDGLRGFAVGALLVLLVWGLIALTGGGPQQVGEPLGPVGTTVTTVATTTPCPSGLSRGCGTRQVTTIAGNGDAFDFTYTSPSHGWESFGGFRLQKSATGPQGAEGIVYWVTYPHTEHATNCLMSPDFYMNRLDKLAHEVVDVPGLALVSGPDDVLVGGQPAQHLTYEIQGQNGCDPGYFYNWKAENVGALWLKYSVGDVVDVWLVDVANQQSPPPLLVIVGLTDPAFPALRDEIQEIVSSIAFSNG